MFYRRVLAALRALPQKRLGERTFTDEGEGPCTLGACFNNKDRLLLDCLAPGYETNEFIATKLGGKVSQVQELIDQNDTVQELTPAHRWKHMVDYVKRRAELERMAELFGVTL